MDFGFFILILIIVGGVFAWGRSYIFPPPPTPTQPVIHPIPAITPTHTVTPVIPTLTPTSTLIPPLLPTPPRYAIIPEAPDLGRQMTCYLTCYNPSDSQNIFLHQMNGGRDGIKVHNLNISRMSFSIKRRDGEWYLLESINPGQDFGVAGQIQEGQYCQFWVIEQSIQMNFTPAEIEACTTNECKAYRDRMLSCE